MAIIRRAEGTSTEEGLKRQTAINTASLGFIEEYMSSQRSGAAPRARKKYGT